MEPETLRCSYRSPEDDFFCEKYGVWYSMRDCNARVLQRTFDGCVNCFQGRVNLRRLHPRLGASPGPGGNLLMFPRPSVADAPLKRAQPPK